MGSLRQMQHWTDTPSTYVSMTLKKKKKKDFNFNFSTMTINKGN